jgi:hypothetical protein
MGVAYGTTTLHQATKGIVQDGLVLNLDPAVKDSYDTGTTWRDLSENGNNVSLVNSPTWAKTKGGIFEFDGSNDRGDVALSTYSSFSTFFFIRYISIAGWNFAIDTLNSTHQMTFHATSSGAGNIAVIGPGNTLITIDSYSNLSTKNWFYFGATYNGSTLTAYKNGISVGSTSATGNVNMSRTGIAARYGTGEHSNRVDFGPIHMYNRALTSDEVARNFNATRHRFGI